MIGNYDHDMKMIGKELTVYGGDAASGSAEAPWLECSARLKKMSHEHKAIHEKATEQWERAYHLGAAEALQDAQLEVLAFAIEKHSNGKVSHDAPPS